MSEPRFVPVSDIVWIQREITATKGVRHWARGHSATFVLRDGTRVIGRVIDRHGCLLYDDGPWKEEPESFAGDGGKEEG